MIFVLDFICTKKNPLIFGKTDSGVVIEMSKKFFYLDIINNLLTKPLKKARKELGFLSTMMSNTFLDIIYDDSQSIGFAIPFISEKKGKINIYNTFSGAI